MLECHTVSKRYGGVAALSDVSLTVPGPGVYGVIGPNGSGKTTLFNVLSGFVKADGGEINFAGRSVGRLPPNKRAQIGIVRTFQHSQVFSGLTVNESLELAALASRTPASEIGVAIERCRLGQYASRRCRETPFGVQRNIGIAMVLLARPRLLMLDEPAAGLTEDEVDSLGTIIRTVATSGVAVMVTDHNVSFIKQLVDHVWVLQSGNLIAQGEWDEVASNDRVRDSYLGTDDT